ncbi:MAG: GIY-YIG nuclease family protein [Candidatus Cloacimonetes bacterium]|nr:GIY-YIG nuclease family protein [Candidatus Cloacimonadota bacterium]
MNEKGYVYVLTNPSFRDDWVKIGKSKRLPDVRGKELSNTAVPLDYEVYATLHTEKYNEAEKMIHKFIDKISDLRINKRREFFNIAPEVIYDILVSIKDLLGDEAILELKGDNVEVLGDESKGKKRSISQRFDFYSRGIKDGDVIQFIEDPNIRAVVQGERTVIFENEVWYLSPLVRELLTRKGNVNSSGAYQGPAYFTYNGKKLTDLTTKK